MNKTLPNTQETKDYLSTLPKLFAVGLFDKHYGVWEVPFAGEYIVDENDENFPNLEIPLVYDFDNSDEDFKEFIVKPINKLNMEDLIIWSQNQTIAIQISKFYEDKHQKALRKQRMQNKVQNPVYCIETKTIFPSARFVEETFGIPSVKKVCCGKMETAGGFHWRYATSADLELHRHWDELYAPVQVQCVETGELFRTVYEAWKKIKKTHPKAEAIAIRQAVKGNAKSAYGYTWRYCKIPGIKSCVGYEIGETLEEKQHYLIRWATIYRRQLSEMKKQEKE